MSAINIIKTEASIYLATDTAAWNANGIVTHFVPKSFVLPTFPAVIATRGSAIAPLLIGWALSSRFQDFDEMVAGIEDAMPEIYDGISADMNGTGFDLILAGFSSARSAAEVYYMTTFTLEDRGYADADEALAIGVLTPDAYQLIPLTDPGYFMPEVTEAELLATGINERLVGFDRPTAAYEMLRTGLELQRRKRFTFTPGGEPFHGIGGSAVVATINKAGVSQEVIHRWQDRVGEPIQPTPIDWKAARAKEHNANAKLADAFTDLAAKVPAPAMNRQQRRALERQQRKKRA